MVIKLWSRIQSIFADPEAIAAYQTVIPKTIHVTVHKDNKCYIATVDKVNTEKIKGLLITEAKSYDELLDQVNDLVYSYINMPSQYRPFYGRVLRPPEDDARKTVGELTLVKA